MSMSLALGLSLFVESTKGSFSSHLSVLRTAHCVVGGGRRRLTGQGYDVRSLLLLISNYEYIIMPMQYVEPELFTEYRGINIYHTYKNQCFNSILQYHYSTSQDDSEECLIFDVRDLPIPDGIKQDNHLFIIQAALDSDNQNLIDIGDQEYSLSEPDSPYLVPAGVWTDDHTIEVEFDAALWLKDASDKDVIALAECEWCQDYAADAVAEGVTKKYWKVSAFFSGLALINSVRNEKSGFECGVDSEAAKEYLKEHRNSLYWDVLVAEGDAVMVEGTMTETLSMKISKTVRMPFMADFNVGPDQEPTDDIEFSNLAESEIRELIMEKTLFDGGHGWEYEGGDSENEVSLSIVKKS